MNVLIWYKRDLRVQDHPALAMCAGAAGVLPLYIVEPALWTQPEKSARQWGFEAETLAGLREDLGAMGAPLVVRIGEAVEVLARACRQHRIDRIISHVEAGCAWTTARNHRVAEWANEAGIEWQELPQQSAIESAIGGKAGALTALPGAEPGVIPQARALRLADDPCPHRQIGGRAQGMALLDSFLARRGQNYREARDHPHLAERGSSRLSPYLALGAISGPQVAQAVADFLAIAPDARPDAASAATLETVPHTDLTAGLKHFLISLRRAAIPGLTAPGLAGTDAMSGVPDFAPQETQFSFRMSQDHRFAAWADGRTGLPFCDAAMRYLMATGWLPDKLRGMVFAVAVGPLGLNPRAAASTLARRFTDYDARLFWPAVTDILAGHAARHLADPVRLGRQLDADGRFTRRWLPELALVPDAHLHSPWRCPQAPQTRYPEAIVDLARAQRLTHRPLPDSDTEVIDRPFARPQSRRFKLAPAGQLSLDL